jgi:serine/threonine protein kinase
LTDYDGVVAAEQHVEGLAKLLSFGRKPATLAVLDSFGYFQYEDQDHRLFGIISAFPRGSDISQSPVSLNELLVDGTKRKRSHSLPSFPQRIGIARRLAITLLELHNAEWLHKDLNSQNIIFFYSGDHEKALDFDAAFVSGFGYARPDDASAMSFDVRGSPMIIYRHPSLLASYPDGQKRPRFQRIHDIYSLGLLLLEVGLWRQVGDFRKANAKPEEFVEVAKQLARQELPHRVGPIYRDVVLRCIDGESLYAGGSRQEGKEAGGNMDDREGRNASLVKFYWSVIRELERCHCE